MTSFSTAYIQFLCYAYDTVRFKIRLLLGLRKVRFRVPVGVRVGFRQIAFDSDMD